MNIDDQLACLSDLRKGRKVIFTSGVFDVFHVGHLELLKAAKKMGDLLVVGVNSDDSVRRLGKGPDRPIHGIEDRMAVLRELRCVDMVIPFDEDTPTELIRKVRPDVHVKGGDYEADKLPEAQAVLEGGGIIAIYPLVPGHSSTSILGSLGG